jgi:hypothetical protein
MSDEIERPIDPEKAVALVRDLRACLQLRESRHFDPLYGWCPPCPWYPAAVLVAAERIVACWSDDKRGL